MLTKTSICSDIFVVSFFTLTVFINVINFTQYIILREVASENVNQLILKQVLFWIYAARIPRKTAGYYD